MAAEVETPTARCATHGSVEAVREIPRLQFPYVVYAVIRWRARRQPFLCPVCERPIEAA